MTYFFLFTFINTHLILIRKTSWVCYVCWEWVSDGIEDSTVNEVELFFSNV